MEDKLLSTSEPSVSALSQPTGMETAYLPERQSPQKDELLAPENEVLYANAAVVLVAGIAIAIVAVSGVIIVYWQHTENDRQEVIRFGLDQFKEEKEHLEEKISQATIKIFNGIREFFAPIRGRIDANSAQITQSIREKVSAIFNEEIAKPAETTPTIPPTTSPNSTVPAPSVPQTPSQARSQVREPVELAPSVPVSPIPTTLIDLEQRIAQIDLEQKQLLQDINANIDRIDTRITQILEEQKQRLRNLNAKIDSINLQLDQLEDRREQERLAPETERLRQQQRDLDLEIAKATIAEDSYNELWRKHLADIHDPNEREEVIREAAALYRQSYPDEIIDIKNPNPHNVILWSTCIYLALNPKRPPNPGFTVRGLGRNQRSGATSQEALGGFGEGPQPQVGSHTGHGPQEKLPDLGGFGAGEPLEVNDNTSHEPSWLQIPERLGGFELDPQLEVSNVFYINEGESNSDQQPKFTPAQKARIDTIDEIEHNWERRYTLSGDNLDPGHIIKIQDAIRGLQKARDALQASLKNPHLDPVARAAIQSRIDTANRLINRANELLGI
ncbi:hypothetical protein [Limnofasciculus baicalensis]|uniref:Uncharacterized protein n=1 Tax=Limnofasciculus baicalensis BBK-W-15 TaxID=2699891 RepID=A0AAE3KLJ3_9CYAN|nr:hypothetical protein [Limnofasciculus baicalensis]MCP2727756.1 hypothetical protein [Limnofasciculus baicalensis BBK-W-15]